MMPFASTAPESWSAVMSDFLSVGAAITPNRSETTGKKMFRVKRVESCHGRCRGEKKQYTRRKSYEKNCFLLGERRSAVVSWFRILYCCCFIVKRKQCVKKCRAFQSSVMCFEKNVFGMTITCCDKMTSVGHHCVQKVLDFCTTPGPAGDGEPGHQSWVMICIPLFLFIFLWLLRRLSNRIGSFDYRTDYLADERDSSSNFAVLLCFFFFFYQIGICTAI